MEEKQTNDRQKIANLLISAQEQKKAQRALLYELLETCSQGINLVLGSESIQDDIKFITMATGAIATAKQQKMDLGNIDSTVERMSLFMQRYLTEKKISEGLRTSLEKLGVKLEA